MGFKWAFESGQIGIECPLNQMGFKWLNWLKRTHNWMDIELNVIHMYFKCFGLQCWPAQQKAVWCASRLFIRKCQHFWCWEAICLPYLKSVTPKRRSRNFKFVWSCSLPRWQCIEHSSAINPPLLPLFLSLFDAINLLEWIFKEVLSIPWSHGHIGAWMLACRRVAEAPQFQMPSTDVVPTARSGHGHAKGHWMPSWKGCYPELSENLKKHAPWWW